MTKESYLQGLSKNELIVLIHNLEYQLEVAEDKVEYLTGCPHFGESDGMNGSCVECSYQCEFLWEKCHPFDSVFWPWHLKKCEQRKKYEEEKNYECLPF